MKKLTPLLLAAALCLSLAGCTASGRANSAARIINGDLEEITAVAAEMLETGRTPEDAFFPGVEDYHFAAPDWVAFQTAYREEEDGSVSTCGFYYVEDDLPRGYESGEGMTLAPDGQGYSWRAPDNEDDRYYTERIQYGWYYYERFFTK